MTQKILPGVGEGQTMNDSGISNLIAIIAPPWLRPQFRPYPAITNFAVADMDATCIAYVRAENNSVTDYFKKINHK